MKIARIVTALAVVTFVAGVVHAAAQQAPPMPKPGPEHEVLKMTTRVMTAFGQGPDGKEAQMLKITYTKRK